ncbi:Uu.00g123180.m01.CDS01 [Anthostomella pinea]|uniref:Uu.00g123180.m01.CDS01 n=1 Tax=Anthostomella pinea TaxID=933095 RepID=A0AAI8VH90_9PEZI|nr:Uu.00g123180.m01.CDS01 [Anthostomella pinea]
MPVIPWRSNDVGLFSKLKLLAFWDMAADLLSTRTIRVNINVNNCNERVKEVIEVYSAIDLGQSSTGYAVVSRFTQVYTTSLHDQPPLTHSSASSPSSSSSPAFPTSSISQGSNSTIHPNSTSSDSFSGTPIITSGSSPRTMSAMGMSLGSSMATSTIMSPSTGNGSNDNDDDSHHHGNSNKSNEHQNTRGLSGASIAGIVLGAAAAAAVIVGLAWLVLHYRRKASVLQARHDRHLFQDEHRYQKAELDGTEVGEAGKKLVDVMQIRRLRYDLGGGGRSIDTPGEASVEEIYC